MKVSSPTLRRTRDMLEHGGRKSRMLLKGRKAQVKKGRKNGRGNGEWEDGGGEQSKETWK